MDLHLHRVHFLVYFIIIFLSARSLKYLCTHFSEMFPVGAYVTSKTGRVILSVFLSVLYFVHVAILFESILLFIVLLCVCISI